MSTTLSDVVLHIDETLPSDQVKTLESHIHKMGGVWDFINFANLTNNGNKCDVRLFPSNICLL